jgi:hypothetical protein
VGESGGISSAGAKSSFVVRPLHIAKSVAFEILEYWSDGVMKYWGDRGEVTRVKFPARKGLKKEQI